MGRVPLNLVHASPHPYGSGTEIDRFVGGAATELAARGHRVLVVAPSDDGGEVPESRSALRAARDRPESLFADDGQVRVLAVGEVLPALSSRRRTALPVDVTRTIEALHDTVPLDICHVHDPFAPSVASAALRHSRALNVGTFHLPAERVVSTQVARRVVELIFGRLDARTASWTATAELMGRFFPAGYRVVRPGFDAAPAPVARAGETVRLVFLEHEERPALRVFLRALRALDDDLPWTATVISARGPSSSTPLRASLRERVRFATPDELDEAEVLAAADVLVAASDGTAPAPGLLARARVAGAVPVASRLPVYEEALGEGQSGLLFEPRDTDTLAAQLERLIRDGELRARLAAVRPDRPWATVADELEAVYGELVARRHDGRGRPEVAARLARRALIDVDLHMHTDHSPDCATPVEVLLRTARARGLGAIAVTDHNEISGAFEAAAKAADFGVKVIVGPLSSSEVNAIMPLANANQVVSISPSSTAPRLALDDYSFRVAPNDAFQARALGRLFQSQGISKIGVIARDDDYGRGIANLTKSIVEAAPYNGQVTKVMYDPLSTRSTASWPAPARTRTWRPGWGRCASACATSTGPRSSSSRCARPTSSAGRPRCSTCRR